MARGWLSPAGGAQRNEATKHDAIEWIDPEPARIVSGFVVLARRRFRAAIARAQTAIVHTFAR